MNDIVTRLRNWRNVHLARLHLLMDEAADEMARLRSDNNRRANLETGLRDWVERLRLTDAEREAVKRAIETLDGFQKRGGWHSAIDDDAATLRSLLERL